MPTTTDRALEDLARGFYRFTEAIGRSRGGNRTLSWLAASSGIPARQLLPMAEVLANRGLVRLTVAGPAFEDVTVELLH